MPAHSLRVSLRLHETSLDLLGRGDLACGPTGPRHRRSTPTHESGKRAERFLDASSFRAIHADRVSNDGACRHRCRWNRPYSRRERTSMSGASFPGVRSRRPRAGRPTGDWHRYDGPPEGGHYEQSRRALATAAIVAEDDQLEHFTLSQHVARSRVRGRGGEYNRPIFDHATRAGLADRPV